MNFRILIVLLVVLFLFPIISHSIPTENLMFEGQLLEYYKFKQTHDLLNRDATNSSLTRGHELKYERLLEEVTNDLLIEPSTKIPELITFITTEKENGNSTGKYFIGLLDSLKSRLLDEDFSNMQYFRELERVILEQSETNSGYLSYLSEKTGDNEPLQDEQYTKWFNDKPWNQGLLKFYGDTLYFTRRFDKAIEIYNKILKTSSKDLSTSKYNSFYESEVRNKLASCHLIQKDYKKAIKEFYKASTLTDVPEAAVNQLFEAHSAIRMKKYKAAQAILNQIKSHKFLPESLYEYEKYKFHYYAIKDVGGNRTLIKTRNGSPELPDLKYKTFFLRSCESNKHYAEIILNKYKRGILFYTKLSVKYFQSKSIKHYVKGIIENQPFETIKNNMSEKYYDYSPKR